ncbi:MAG: hypothetical protein DRO09_02580 [Thermoprotei archaeon]|nr:MAG: hypothetical protein DRO09_02580 [Thermoprotei archaeon]
MFTWKHGLILAVVFTLLLIILNAEPVRCDGEIIYNASGYYVKVPKLETSINFEGLVINAYYLNETHVKLIAFPMSEEAQYTNATFKLYDYWDSSLIGTYDFQGELEVQVPSNITIIYVYVGGREIGPYYVSSITFLVTVPEEIKVLVSLFPLAFLVALAARGNVRETGLGMLAYSIMYIPLARVFGINMIYYYAAVPAFSFIMGFLILLLSYERKT